MTEEEQQIRGKSKAELYSEYIGVEHDLQDLHLNDSNDPEAEWNHFNKISDQLIARYDELRELLNPEFAEYKETEEKLHGYLHYPYAREILNLGIRLNTLRDLLGIKE